MSEPASQSHGTNRLQQAVRAVRLARWFAHSALNIMTAGRMERRLSRLNKLVTILGDYRGTQTLRELERRHCFSHQEVKQLAIDFPDRLRCDRNQETGGRPTESISIVRNR